MNDSQHRLIPELLSDYFLYLFVSLQIDIRSCLIYQHYPLLVQQRPRNVYELFFSWTQVAAALLDHTVESLLVFKALPNPTQIQSLDDLLIGEGASGVDVVSDCACE